MQLDNTRIAIRERDLADVLDLSLQVIRAYALPWFLASLAGALPLAVLNWWLLKSKWLSDGPQNKAALPRLDACAGGLRAAIGQCGIDAVYRPRGVRRSPIGAADRSRLDRFAAAIVLLPDRPARDHLLAGAGAGRDLVAVGGDLLVDAFRLVSLPERSDPARAQSADADPRADDHLAAKPGVCMPGRAAINSVAGWCR